MPLHFGQAFEIPKDFSRKVLCVRAPRQTPQHSMPHAKKHGTSRAFLYYTTVSILSAFELLASYILSDKKAYFKLTEKP